MTINQSSDSLTLEKPQPLQECEGEIQEIFVEQDLQKGVQGQSAAYGHTIDSEPALHPLEATYTSDSAMGDVAYRPPSMALILDESTKDSQIICLPPSPSEVGQREMALPDIDGKASGAQALSAPFLSHGTEPHETALPGATPSTPVRQIAGGFHSPLSDDQTVTPNTTLLTPVHGEALSPLTEDGRSASPPDIVKMILPEEIPSSPSGTGQQETRLCNTAFAEAQHVNADQSLQFQIAKLCYPLFHSERPLH
jgi:hypothetical protein